MPMTPAPATVAARLQARLLATEHAAAAREARALAADPQPAAPPPPPSGPSFEEMARTVGFEKDVGTGQLWTRRDMLGLARALHAKLGAGAAEPAPKPALKPSARAVPLPFSRTPLHDEMERLSGAEKTTFFRQHRAALARERQRNP